MTPPVQSLDWETFEQYSTWQLFLAHSIPLETIIPILQHLKYKGELHLLHPLPQTLSKLRPIHDLVSGLTLSSRASRGLVLFAAAAPQGKVGSAH